MYELVLLVKGTEEEIGRVFFTREEWEIFKRDKKRRKVHRWNSYFIGLLEEALSPYTDDE